MRQEIKKIIEKADNEGRKSLTEVEVYEIFKILELNVPEYIYACKKDIEVKSFSRRIFDLINTNKVVIKIVSSTNIHKTDSGGVKIVEKEITKIEKVVKELLEFKDIDGIMAIEFIDHCPFALGEELLLGARADDAYGPILVIGPGGTHTESFVKVLKSNVAPSFISIVDLDSAKIKKFIEDSWILKYCLGGVRGVKPLTTFKEIENWINKIVFLMKNFSNLESDDYLIEEVEINPLALNNKKFYALDGVLRFKKKKSTKRVIPSDQAIKSILEPKTIGVIGVSEKKMNMARIILNNTIRAGFPKENIFVIKDGVSEIDGVKAYPTIFDVPKEIDMYVIAVPVENVIEVIEDAAKSMKVNGVVLITGGIGEKSGSEDVAKKLYSVINIAREKNPKFSLNGGNCMGIVLNKAMVNTFFIPEYKMKYPLGHNPDMVKTAFVSQSGAFVIATLTKIPHIIPDYTITVGNQQDLTVVDYLDYFSRQDDLKVILGYIEGFKNMDGLRLINIIRRAKESGKIVILYKAGRTPVGQKAVMGHTASIAGDYLVSKNLLSGSGAIVCEDFEEFCDIAYLACYYSKYEIKTKNCFMMSNAGFETTGMGDNISILQTHPPSPLLATKVLDVMKKYKLDSISDFKNPMDTTPMANDDAISELIENIAADDMYSSIFVSMVPLTPNLNTLKDSNEYPDKLEKSFIVKTAEVMKKNKKPIVLCVSSGNLYEPYIDFAIKHGFVVFRNADRMVKMFEKYLSNVEN
ncbi:MAG: acetate--CoA ligase family protein [Elusimicrobiota bacterium]